MNGTIPVFSGETADEVWIRAATAFADGAGSDQPSRDGPTKELLHSVLQISDPRQRWIPSRRPAANPAFAVAEALWILWGRNDESIPVFFNPKFPRFSGPGPVYAGAYGHRLRRAFGLDQLERGADALAGNPSTRQVVLQIWDSAADLPHPDGSCRRGDVPCNIVSLLKLRHGHLHWTQVLRSNDLVLGVPHNVVQFTILQEVLAGWLGVQLGPYVQLSDSLHVYTRDLQSVEGAFRVTAARNEDSLALARDTSKRSLADLESRVDVLIRPGLDRVAFERLAYTEDLPIGYRNLLAVLGADVARRRGWIDLMERSAARCSNPALTQMWQGWLARQADDTTVRQASG